MSLIGGALQNMILGPQWLVIILPSSQYIQTKYTSLGNNRAYLYQGVPKRSPGLGWDLTLFQPITGQDLDVPSENRTPFFRSILTRPTHPKRGLHYQTHIAEVLHSRHIRQDYQCWSVSNDKIGDRGANTVRFNQGLVRNSSLSLG